MKFTRELREHGENRPRRLNVNTKLILSIPVYIYDIVFLGLVLLMNETGLLTKLLVKSVES
jgi:hypothetical protein